MHDVRSVAAGGRDRAHDVARRVFPRFAKQFPTKLYWFISKGYRPHEWQASFHAAADPVGRLIRFRHLVAGRRGGKTLSAAWEVLFYALHPEEFHMDFKGEVSSRPLWIQVLAKDHKVGFPSEQALRECLDQAGLVHNKDYRWNKSEKYVEFENGTLLQFKTADDPQSLRGAGLDILWIDEAAMLPTREPWDVIRPSLSDKPGLLITTTTPRGKNWFYEEFFTGGALADEFQFRVEYISLDNPYFKRHIWEYEKRTMHPAMFKQEYMAAFDAMAGLTLSGEWLHYYVTGKPEHGEVGLPRAADGTIRLRKFIGIDTSTGEAEDSFAIALIGVSDDAQVFLLDCWKDKIQFPDQIDKVREWFYKYRPEQIGIEATAFQRVLAQMAARLEGLPNVIPVFSKGKKVERIVSMSPLFKVGKVRIHAKTHVEFIDEWVSFDGASKTNRDDLLDAVEIALGCAGILLPSNLHELEAQEKKGRTIHDEAREQIERLKDTTVFHPTLGTEV